MPKGDRVGPSAGIYDTKKMPPSKHNVIWREVTHHDPKPCLSSLKAHHLSTWSIFISWPLQSIGQRATICLTTCPSRACASAWRHYRDTLPPFLFVHSLEALMYLHCGWRANNNFGSEVSLRAKWMCNLRQSSFMGNGIRLLRCFSRAILTMGLAAMDKKRQWHKRSAFDGLLNHKRQPYYHTALTNYLKSQICFAPEEPQFKCVFMESALDPSV